MNIKCFLEFLKTRQFMNINDFISQYSTRVLLSDGTLYLMCDKYGYHLWDNKNNNRYYFIEDDHGWLILER